MKQQTLGGFEKYTRTAVIPGDPNSEDPDDDRRFLDAGDERKLAAAACSTRMARTS